MVKRRNLQERDEATAHEQAEARREALLAELRAREAAAHPTAVEPPPAEAAELAEATPDAAPDPVPGDDDASED
jgi:hypothetical protein